VQKITILIDAFCTAFFHPDYTVGPGVSPDHAGFIISLLVGFTTDRELCKVTRTVSWLLHSPCPEGCMIHM
jgi:hypothetical protein